MQWSAPQTNRLLLEAGFWRHQETWGSSARRPTIVDPLAIGVTDNNPQTLVPGYVQLIQNYHGRVGATDTPSHNPNYRGNFAMSYVTGSHSFKTGFDLNGATSVGRQLLGRAVQLRREHAGQQRRGRRHPRADSLHAALGRLHRSARPPGQRRAGGRPHVRSSPYCPTPAPSNKVHQRRRRLRPGPVDDGPADAQRGLALSTGSIPRIPTFHLGPSLLTPNRNYDVPAFRHDALQGLDAQGRRGLRPVRRRQDGAEGQLRQVRPRAGAGVGGLASQPGYNVQLTSSRTGSTTTATSFPIAT